MMKEGNSGRGPGVVRSPVIVLKRDYFAHRVVSRC